MYKRIFNVSSVRMMRFLYALGFEKKSYFTSSGDENWEFEWSEDLQNSINFYREMRSKNRNRS